MIIKADLHTHTELSFDGRQTLDQLTCAARKKGLDAVAVTEHKKFNHLPYQMNGVLLIHGFEFNSTEGHIVGLFLEEPPQWSSGTPQEIVAEIHRCGGIAVLAHPFQNPRRRLDDYLFAIDGVETANARAAYKNPKAHRMAEQLAAVRNLKRFGGSDAHSPSEVGNAYTVIHCEEKTLESIKDALLNGAPHSKLKRNTPRRMIGLSQLKRRIRMGGFRNRMVGWAYLLKCIALDLIKFK